MLTLSRIRAPCAQRALHGRTLHAPSHPLPHENIRAMHAHPPTVPQPRRGPRARIPRDRLPRRAPPRPNNSHADPRFLPAHDDVLDQAHSEAGILGRDWDLAWGGLAEGAGQDGDGSGGVDGGVEGCLVEGV